MAGKDQERQFIGVGFPYGGVSCLPWRWENGKRAAIAANIDSSQGTIRPRQGPGLITLNDLGKCTGMYGFRSSDGRSIVVQMLTQPYGDVAFRAYQGDPLEGITGGHSLTTESMQNALVGLAHPPENDGWMVATDIGGVCFFTTPAGVVYEYDPVRLVERPKVVKAAVGMHATIAPYLTTIPKGALVCSFAGRLVVADLDGTHWMNTQALIPDDTDEVPVEWIDGPLKTIRYPRNVVLMSDPNNPRAFRATNFFQAAGGSVVTGLASDRAGLLVFTEQSVCRLQQNAADSLVGWNLDQVLSGVGCVAARTVVQGGGLTAWLSHDGFWTIGPNGAERISDDIGDLFTPHGWRHPAAQQVAADLASLGYPWRVSRSLIDSACGVYDDAAQCFRWSLPLSGSDFQNGITVIYSLVTREWDFAVPMLTTGGGEDENTPLAYAKVWRSTGPAIWFGNHMGHVCQVHGAPYDLMDDGGDAIPILAVWQSPAVTLDPNVRWQAQTMRIRHMATNPSGSSGKFTVEPETSFEYEALADPLRSTDARPSAGPPNYTPAPAYVWPNGAWNAFAWHQPGTWQARYNVGDVPVGSAFTVAFRFEQAVSRPAEVLGWSIEIIPREEA